MADFKVTTDVLKEAEEELKGLQTSLRSYEDQIREVGRALNFKVSAAGTLKFKISSIANNVDSCSQKMGKMSSAAQKISTHYRFTENSIKSFGISPLELFHIFADTVATDSHMLPSWLTLSKEAKECIRKLLENIPPNGEMINAEKLRELVLSAASWYNDLEHSTQDWIQTMTGSGALAALLTTGSLSGVFFDEHGALLEGEKIIGNDKFNAKFKGKIGEYSSKSDGEIDFDLKNGNIGAHAGWQGEVHAASGEISLHSPWSDTTINGSVGNAGASGEVGCTLFSNGEFSPQLTAKGKVGVNAAEGSFSSTTGNDDINYHTSGHGKVLSAEASGEATIGKIVSTDASGNQTVSYGAKAEVSAEAYLAQGEISGGFSIFGVKIDLGLGGKAGGAGVKAGGSITTNGVEGSIGAGLGLGADIKLKIDWSGFRWPWQKK